MLWCRGIYSCLLCTTKHATHYRLYIPDSWGASHGPCLQTPKNFAELLSQEAPKHQQHPRYNAPQFNKICQCHRQVLQLQSVWCVLNPFGTSSQYDRYIQKWQTFEIEVQMWLTADGSRSQRQRPYLETHHVTWRVILFCGVKGRGAWERDQNNNDSRTVREPSSTKQPT